jgi:FMN phosphatase YigB (HAD superfamily)
MLRNTNNENEKTLHVDDPRWTEREAAEYLNISMYWLQKDRSQNLGGPVFEYIGAHVRYRKSALDSYVEENTRKRLHEQLKFTFPVKVKP